MNRKQNSNDSIGCLAGIPGLVIIVASGIFLIKSGYPNEVWIGISFVVIVGFFFLFPDQDRKSLKVDVETYKHQLKKFTEN